MPKRIDIIFDLAQGQRYFDATVSAVHHAVDFLEVDADIHVVRTDTIDAAYVEALPAAVLIGPGTPYRVPDAAEAVIQSARERGVPLVGT